MTDDKCVKCDATIEGQSYILIDWGNGNDDTPQLLHICQTCELKHIDRKIHDKEYEIEIAQVHVKDLKKRRAKVEKNEPEFS
jgi:hypothetical protein